MPGAILVPVSLLVRRGATATSSALSVASRLLMFGPGPRYCLGAALARITLEEVVVAIGAVSDRIAPEGDLRNVERRQVVGRSPSALPVVARL